MKQAKQIPQPNDVRKLHSLWQIRAIPGDVGVHMGSISHNDWCAIFQDKCCDCDAEIRLTATVQGCLNYNDFQLHFPDSALGKP